MCSFSFLQIKSGSAGLTEGLTLTLALETIDYQFAPHLNIYIDDPPGIPPN